MLAVLVSGYGFLHSRQSFAGGYYNPDFGSRRVGMMAVIGYPNDPTAIFHNTAALVLLKGTQLYHSQTWTFAEAEMKMYDSQGKLWPEEGVISPDWSIGLSPFFAVASDFRTERFRGGLAIYAPNMVGAMLPDSGPSRYHVVQALFIAPRLTAAFAYEITPKFSVGFNANLVTTFLSATNKMNPLVLADPDKRFLPDEEMEATDATLELNGSSVAWSVDASVYFRPTPDFRIGVVFMGGNPADLEGPVRLRYSDETVVETTQHTRMAIPFTLQAGFNWQLAPNFQWGVDGRFWHYQVNQVQETRLDDPLMGITSLVTPKNYDNSWSLGTGFYHNVSSNVAVMLGTQYDHSPIPLSSITMDNPVRHRIAASFGLQWNLTAYTKVGLSLMRTWFMMFDVQNSVTTPPTNAKGHGALTQIGLDILWRL